MEKWNGRNEKDRNNSVGRESAFKRSDYSNEEMCSEDMFSQQSRHHKSWQEWEAGEFDAYIIRLVQKMVDGVGDWA
jgi:hypothetical protein